MVLTLLQGRFLQPPGDSLSCPVCKNVLCDPVTVREYDDTSPLVQNSLITHIADLH